MWGEKLGLSMLVGLRLLAGSGTEGQWEGPPPSSSRTRWELGLGRKAQLGQHWGLGKRELFSESEEAAAAAHLHHK